MKRLVQSDAPRPQIMPPWFWLAIALTVFALVVGFAMMKVTLWAVSIDQGKQLSSLAEKARETAKTIVTHATASPGEL